MANVEPMRAGRGSHYGRSVRLCLQTVSRNPEWGLPRRGFLTTQRPNRIQMTKTRKIIHRSKIMASRRLDVAVLALGYLSYEEYLVSTHWRVFRARALQAYGDCCGTCGSAHDLQVHHLTYARLGQEMLSDVKVLCRSCHRAVHGLSQQTQQTHRAQGAASICPPNIDPDAWTSVSIRRRKLEQPILQMLVDRPMTSSQIASELGWPSASRIGTVMKGLRGNRLVRRQKMSSAPTRYHITSKGIDHLK